MKKSKKIYNWKYKFLRKKRSVYTSQYLKAPKSFVRFYNSSHRKKEKLNCNKILKGENPNTLIFPFYHRHSANWDYW